MIEVELSAESLTVRELSKRLSVSEKDILGHLPHVERSVARWSRFVITPSECPECGFIFSKRTRLKRPSKCPSCRGEEITEPSFRILER